MILSTGKFPRNSLQLKCLEEDAHVGGREKKGGSEAVLMIEWQPGDKHQWQMML